MGRGLRIKRGVEALVLVAGRAGWWSSSVLEKEEKKSRRIAMQPKRMYETTKRALRRRSLEPLSGIWAASLLSGGWCEEERSASAESPPPFFDVIFSFCVFPPPRFS